MANTNELTTSVIKAKRTNKVYSAWSITPTNLKHAIEQAEKGDPAKLIELLKDVRTIDGHLAGELETRKQALLGYDFEVVGENEDQRQFTYEVIYKLGYYAFLENILESGYEGLRILDMIWQYDNSKIKPVRFEALDNTNLRSIRSYTGVGNPLPKEIESILDVIEYKDESDWIKLSKTPGKYFVCDFSTLNYKNLPVNFLRMGYGVSCIYWSLVKHYNMQDWSAFNEKFGMAFILGKYMEGASKDDITRLETAVHNAGSDMSAVISNTTDIDVKESQKYSSTNTYETLYDRANREQSKIITGVADMAELGPNGARSAKETQNKVRLEKIISDGRYAESLIKTQLINPLLSYNFASPDPTIKLKIKIAQPIDLEKEMRILREFYEMGNEIPTDWVYEHFQIPKPKEGEATFKKITGGIGLLGN